MPRSERTSPPGQAFFSVWHAFISTVQAAAVTVLILIITITFTNVVRRFVGASSYLWVEEAARVLLMWLTFLGGVLAVARGTHLVLDFLTGRGSRLAQRAVHSLVVIASFTFFGLLIYEGWHYSLLTSRRLLPSLEISAGWMVNAGVIGGMLFTIALTGRLIATSLAGPSGVGSDRINGAADTPAESTD